MRLLFTFFYSLPCIVNQLKSGLDSIEDEHERKLDDADSDDEKIANFEFRKFKWHRNFLQASVV